jgi:acetylornithine/succinyldiaminopimelate/putrescine aminotransferase
MEQNATFSNTKARASKTLIPSLSEDWPLLPVVRAEGVYIYTANGRRYMDFTSGIAVTNVGHGIRMCWRLHGSRWKSSPIALLASHFTNLSCD